MQKITTTLFATEAEINSGISFLENQGWTIQDVKPCNDGRLLIIAWKATTLVPVTPDPENNL